MKKILFGKNFRHIREKGSVANIMVTGIFVLTMCVMMMIFLDNMQLISQKTEINQLARQYILIMETKGGLTAQDEELLLLDLEDLGASGVDLEGTTMGHAGYGERIVLHIHGTLGGRYDFEEKKVSTAKY